MYQIWLLNPVIKLKHFLFLHDKEIICEKDKIILSKTQEFDKFDHVEELMRLSPFMLRGVG